MKFGQFTFSTDFRAKHLLLHHHSIAKPSLVNTVKAKVPLGSSKIMDRQNIFKEKDQFTKKQILRGILLYLLFLTVYL